MKRKNQQSTLFTIMTEKSTFEVQLISDIEENIFFYRILDGDERLDDFLNIEYKNKFKTENVFKFPKNFKIDPDALYNVRFKIKNKKAKSKDDMYYAKIRIKSIEKYKV